MKYPIRLRRFNRRACLDKIGVGLLCFFGLAWLFCLADAIAQAASLLNK